MTPYMGTKLPTELELRHLTLAVSYPLSLITKTPYMGSKLPTELDH